ncbi:MAG: ATP-binding protein, partial [Candidatus Woesearchaeota archaeon]
MSMFINRKEELNLLESIYNSNKAELVLVYGRRRIGKSTLLRESIKNRNALYLLVDLSKNILEILSMQINSQFVKFLNWDNFFDFIEKSEYEIFIIDEFQYLYNLDKAWPSILQRRWETLKKTKKKLILCGSIISTIYKISYGYGAALYGRKTYEIEITQLNFEHIKEFFDYKKEDLVKIYAILGGIPRYLEEFDKNKSIETNIKEKILNKNSFLYNEPINILFEEFRDSSSYISILLAISQGFNKFNEISQYSKIQPNKLPKYLNVLERIKIIEKQIPITENKIKGKITHY